MLDSTTSVCSNYFLSYTTSCVGKRLFARSRARKHDFYINFFKKKKLLQLYFIMNYGFFLAVRNVHTILFYITLPV